MYVLDTNVMSEVRKGERCDPNVAKWRASVPDDQLYLSVLVLGEIRKGVESARSQDPRRAEVFENWLREIELNFAERILPVTDEVADRWGRMAAIRTVPVDDSLMAATAAVHDMIFVTRNVRHVHGLGVEVLNPFE